MLLCTDYANKRHPNLVTCISSTLLLEAVTEEIDRPGREKSEHISLMVYANRFACEKKCEGSLDFR
jgi:hypothetical protein